MSEDRLHYDSPTVTNVGDLPPDLKVTKQFEEKKDSFKYRRIIVIRGNRGSGKSYLSKYLSIKELGRVSGKAALAWNFKAATLIQLEDELKCMEEKLKAKWQLLDFKALSNDVVERLCGLIKHLNSQKVHCVFTLSGANKGIRSEMKQILECILHQSVEHVESKAIIVIQDNCDIFSYREMEKVHSDNVMKVSLTGFQQKEAVQYLEGRGDLDEGAEELAECLGGHPLLLKAAWEFCASRKITYKDLYNQIATDIKSVYAEFMKVLQDKNLESMRFLQGLALGNVEEKFVETLEKLCLIGTGDIPIRVLDKICEQPSNMEYRHNSKEFLEKVGKIIPINPVKIGEIIKFISFPKFFFFQFLQNLKQDENKVGERLLVVMKVLTSLFSRDNREWHDDVHLSNTKDHIHDFIQNAQKHLKFNFNMKKQLDEDYFIWMGICKLYALLGQAYVQSRMTDSWKEALNFLLKGAEHLWNVVNSYSKTGILNFCFFSESTSDILEYERHKNAEQVAKKVAERCVEAGKKIKTHMVEEYMRSNIKFNKSAFADFVDNLAQTDNITEEEARKQLMDIWETVQDGNCLSDEQIDRLRKSGNLLEVEKYKKVFLAERLCDFFHTYGRQDLYVWEKMQGTEDQLEMCKFYTEFSHHIAKQVRIKTGVGLLYEFITVSNCQVPRSLQNREENEAEGNRLKRLREAYDLAKELVNNPIKYYENGMYMATQRSTYAKLNAQKYMVKAANKMLKRGSEVPNDALATCESMLALAKDQIYLDMGPTSVIMAAKFFASVGEFEKSFNAFNDGFSMKKGENEYGIFQHFEKNPNTFAWAVFNYARAVKAAVVKNHPADVRKAIQRCNQVFDMKNEKLDKEKWVNVLQELVRSLE